MKDLPKIAITLGDPCGVGPEVIIKALSAMGPPWDFIPIVIGEPKACIREIRRQGVNLPIVETDNIDMISPSHSLIVHNPSNSLDECDLEPAKPTAQTARAVIKWIEKAVAFAMDGHVHAICTAPINKDVLAAHGFNFPGHTEFLQSLTGANNAVMMLAGPKLKVTLVTIHLPLAQVPSVLSSEKIIQVIQTTSDSLIQFFGIEHPKIAVCGLNPHAGEAGRFGREEAEIITPAVATFESVGGSNVYGPFPADTVFFRAVAGDFDAVVAMYHDQGLIPVKLLHFHEAVNITLGLPIIRTSVDHGTAYDIAGKGIAHPGSMISALKMAAEMSVRKKRL